jgi:FAD synthetase
MKEVLAAIWRQDFAGAGCSRESLETELKDRITGEFETALAQLEDEGLIVSEDGAISLSEAGRKEIRVVVCGGVFDILHPGHAFILGEAKSMGDVLVVIVARDSTVEKRKRIPIVPEGQRVEMVGHLKPVDAAVLGYEGDPLVIIGEIRPDVIALGPDQHHNEERIRSALEKRGLSVEVRRISEFRDCELNSTRSILERIIERNYPNPQGEV